MTIVKTYAQLVRLPNLFTALADILLGAFACGAFEKTGWWRYGFLLAASACFYSGGMVWNDFFDVDQDRRERPYRPIPSGRVSRSQAARLGAVLLASGLLLATASGFLGGEMNFAPATAALLLIAAIVIYDAWLKRTPLGPLGMGLCRFLNVLMALAVCPTAAWTGRIYLAMIVGIYIVGVTWFARTEARVSSQASLIVGAAIMLFGLCLALPLPIVATSLRSEPVTSILFPYLLVALAFLVGIPVARALERPKPELVQAAVKRAIFGLVLLDATLATALAGVAGLAIAMLLLPAMYLGRWLYST